MKIVVYVYAVRQSKRFCVASNSNQAGITRASDLDIRKGQPPTVLQTRRTNFNFIADFGRRQIGTIYVDRDAWRRQRRANCNRADDVDDCGRTTAMLTHIMLLFVSNLSLLTD